MASEFCVSYLVWYGQVRSLPVVQVSVDRQESVWLYSLSVMLHSFTAHSSKMVWAVTPVGQHNPGSRDLTPCPHPEEQDDHGPHIRIWQYFDAVHFCAEYGRKVRTIRNNTNVSSFLDLGLMMDWDRPESEQSRPRSHQMYAGYLH